MLSVPSASALSSFIILYLVAMAPVKTVLLMNCLNGAHEFTLGIRLTASIALKQLRTMSSFRSTCMLIGLLANHYNNTTKTNLCIKTKHTNTNWQHSIVLCCLTARPALHARVA